MAADFSYTPMHDGAGLQLTATLLADRDDRLAEMGEDARAAGFRVLRAEAFEEFVQGDTVSLGDLLMIDIAAIDATAMAMLSRLDMRAGKAGVQIVVSTSIDALDAVFGCFAMASPQILVDPNRAERVLALGRVLARIPGARLREMREEDHFLLLRLSQQVTEIAQRLDGFADRPRGTREIFRVQSPGPEFRGAGRNGEGSDGERPKLPDAAAIRRIIARRKARAEYFDPALFADPAWDILLDLAAARAERKRVSVTSLCIASGVPATTALRWIGQMVESGLLLRVADRKDRRRAYIALSEEVEDAIARYFAAIGVGESRGMACAWCEAATASCR